MNSAEALTLLQKHGAISEGHFRLSSGLHSDTYVQCAVVCQWPGIAERLGHEIGVRFAPDEPTAVLGPAMGGIVIGHEVARQLGVRMVFSERVDGEMTLRRGFQLTPEDRVLVAEDVVTTGKSQKEAMSLAEGLGAEVVGVGAIVDRSEGAALRVRFESLVEIRPERWDPDGCPLCARGAAIESPGSRHLVR